MNCAVLYLRIISTSWRSKVSLYLNFGAGEEVANLDAQLKRTMIGLEQTAVARKNISDAISAVESHRQRVNTLGGRPV